MRKVLISGLLSVFALIGYANANEDLFFTKGETLVSDFGNIVERSEINDALKARGGKLVSRRGAGSVSGIRLVAQGDDGEYYFIKVNPHTGVLMWFAPTNLRIARLSL
ncbi:MAG: hypothetical protein AAGD92_14150 [Pseudomonadota bacterium]